MMLLFNPITQIQKFSHCVHATKYIFILITKHIVNSGLETALEIRESIGLLIAAIMEHIIKVNTINAIKDRIFRGSTQKFSIHSLPCKKYKLVNKNL